MKKVKIHPLIILALCISALSMGRFAYRYYQENTAIAMIFVVLCLLSVNFAIFGIIRNRRIKDS